MLSVELSLHQAQILFGRKKNKIKLKPKKIKIISRSPLEQTIPNNSHAHRTRGGKLNVDFQRTFGRKNQHMAYV